MIFPRQRLQCGASTALPSAGRFYQLLNARISFSGFLHFLSFFFFFFNLFSPIFYFFATPCGMRGLVPRPGVELSPLQ